MRREMCSVGALLWAACVFAGPAVEKRDPVAEGFPDWEGLTDRNFLTGPALRSRAMTPSDLRHKAVAVIEADVADLKKFQTEQLPLVAPLARYNSYFDSSSGASLGMLLDGAKVPRSSVVLISLRGKPSAAVAEAFSAHKDADLLKKIGLAGTSYCPVYFNAGMVGAPENAEGKYPFAYVLDGKSDKPVWKGVLTAANVQQVVKVFQAARKDLPEWTPMTGVAEAQFHKAAFRQIREGKFKAAQKALAAGVRSKDAASAAEAQKMYDAIQQYQTDMIHLIAMESRISPPLAYSDFQRFSKLVPSAKKSLAAEYKAMLASPGVVELADIVTKYRLWTGADYKPKNAAEVKKNVGEIAKWKKTLALFEKSTNTKTQGDALTLNAVLETLPSTLESKVAK